MRGIASSMAGRGAGLRFARRIESAEQTSPSEVVLTLRTRRRPGPRVPLSWPGRDGVFRSPRCPNLDFRLSPGEEIVREARACPECAANLPTPDRAWG
ncbi:hypothetical protein EP7_003161 [Isosphaeraceae bacterium EP7]